MLDEKNLKILVVDDEEVIFNIICEMLADRNYVFISATTSREAIDFANKYKPDLILLDVNLGSSTTNGFEICRQIKSNPETKETPVIFVTGSYSQLKLGFDVGAVDYIIKPFTESELKARVQTHLNLRRAMISLQEMNSVLEQKVSERTAELKKYNEDLQREIEERRLIEDLLQFNASHDALTGFLNRNAFEEKIISSLIRKTESKNSNLIYVDIDRLYIINEACGQEGGNTVLNNIAAIIRRILRQHKIYEANNTARVGGDSFAILFTDSALVTSETIAEEIRLAIKNTPFEWANHSYPITVSIAVVPITDETIAINNVLGTAEEICDGIVENGGDKIVRLEADVGIVKKVKSEIEMIILLREALRDDKFILVGQKIVPVKNAADCDFYEVLLRVKNHDNQELTPGIFLRAAERYNLMPDIDRWIIKRMFQWLNKKFLSGEKVKLAINLSGQSVNDENLGDFILEEYAQYTFDSALICFEITESIVILNLEKTRSFIDRLCEKGFLFSLDDFGAGFASYAYLKELPVHYLKIDGFFIKDMLVNKINEAVVRSMNEVAKASGKITIAEYVENKETINRLEEIGVDFAQGFYLHYPEKLIPEN